LALALALALAFTDYNADPPRRPAWPHGFAASRRRSAASGTASRRRAHEKSATARTVTLVLPP
ncbi:hypothetical protein, partial [Burkholderia pseudomallei]|nr:hypothetical protein [Burkholderia pseudomallei]